MNKYCYIIIPYEDITYLCVCGFCLISFFLSQDSIQNTTFHLVIVSLWALGDLDSFTELFLITDSFDAY